jgi:hypothetical protein
MSSPRALRLDVRPSAEDAIVKLPDAEQAAALAALRAIPATFGRPHVHSGLGIRQLRPGVFEARVGLQLRAVFIREGDTLKVHLIGDHNDVRSYLRSL